MCNKCIWLIAFVLALALFAGLAQGQTVYINFQQPASETPEGYLPDAGAVFGDRGNGFSYGWDRDINAEARDRDSGNAPDQRWDTLIHLQKGADVIWEIALENGLYNVYIVAGDAGYTDQINTFDIEGVLVEDPDGEAGNFDELTATVTVADGRLTLTTAEGADNAKICFIDIVLAMSPEAARSPSPAKNATDVPRDVILGWEPGEGVSAHDVYFGSSFDDVNNASRANPMDVLLSQGQAAETYAPGRLEFSRTYYWRIDEVLADGSIPKGEVWSFTVEPLAYAVENVAASTNATSDPGLGLDNTINGSGLNAADQHSMESSDMWLGLPSGADPVWIQYAFDQAYKLDEMLVWNYNVQFEPVLGFGLKDVTIEYSADGAAWTVLGDVEFAQATARNDYVANTAVDFGGAAVKLVRMTVNGNYSSLPQYGLSEVRFMYIPATARAPQPASEASEVSVDSVLSWRSGREVASHEIYLGTDDDDLALVETTTNASFMPDALNFGTTYYWRVDEVNEAEAISVWEGGVWSFMVQEYAVIDDFESYTDDLDAGEAIFQTWIDGWDNNTGSTVGHLDAPFAEQTTVHGGRQSMPLAYDNSVAPFYSEAENDLGGMNWTANGADTLRLFFRGNPVDFLERADGSIVIGAAGTDIAGTSDEFRYVYKQLSGDGEIIARVDSLVEQDPWSKAGLMIRETLTGGSPFAGVFVTPGNGCRFQARQADNAAHISDTSVATPEQIAITAPYWVKLTRTGNEFNAYYSADGVTWTSMVWNSQSITMAGNIYIGLAVTSHNAGNPTRAEFSEVATTGGVTGAWQVQAIGVEQPSNEFDQLYIAVEDTSGSTQVIVHPDPEAVGTADWQTWAIPLSEFSGINVASVRTMYIGVGDRDNPAAAGTGLVYIDDIEYGHPASEPAPEPSYLYDGDALDDAWDHDNGSDAWDGLPIGQGMPGGVAALVEDDVTFLRIQDTGDPRDYEGRSDPTNRKVYFTHVTNAGLDGARIEFRIRVATSAPLDDMYPDGGAGVEPWPAGGIGYHIRDDGTGMIGIAEADLGIISFSLAKAGEAGFEDMTTDVLVMNNLVGTVPSGDVDTDAADDAVTARNWIAVDDATQWHTFVVDITAGGAGTHVVSVSVDGAAAEVLDVTVGTKLEAEGGFIAIGSSGTGGITAFDVDYISYVAPNAEPEP